MTFNLKKLIQYLTSLVLRLNLTFFFKYRCVRHKVNKNVH